jgi:hypothetical protein
LGSSSTQTTNNKPYEAAQPMIDQGLQDAQNLYNSGGFNITPYGGDMVADFTQNQNLAYGAAQGLTANSLQNNYGAQQTLQGMMNPDTQSGAWDQIRSNTIAEIMPAINSSFAGSGMTGSTLHAQNLAKGLSAGLAGVENDFYQTTQNRALNAANSIGGVQQNNQNALDYLAGTGAAQQTQAQNELNAQILQDQQAQTAQRDAINDYLALTTGAGSAFGVQSSTTQNSPGLFSLLGLGAQVL